MPDAAPPAMPDYATFVPASVRANGTPARAVLAAELSPGAQDNLPTGKDVLAVLYPVPGGGRLDLWRVAVTFQLDMWAPDRTAAHEVWDSIRRWLTRRGGFPLTGGGSVSSAAEQLILTRAQSESDSLGHYISTFDVIVSTRGGA